MQYLSLFFSLALLSLISASRARPVVAREDADPGLLIYNQLVAQGIKPNSTEDVYEALSQTPPL